MVRSVRGLVLAGSIVLAACGGGAIAGNGGVPTPSPGSGDDSTSGPIIARQIDGEVYPGTRALMGGVVNQSESGCWMLVFDDGGGSMIIWPSDAVVADDGRRIGSGGEIVRSGSVIQGLAALVPIANLSGVVDGYWGSVTSFCDEQVAAVVFDALTVVADAQTSLDLSVDYPCGIGFSVASEDQHVALILNVQDASTPDLSGRVSFPDENWAGELLIGKDLMVTWCNDAIEEGLPVPVIHARFPIVAGSLSFDPPPRDGARCEPNPVTATTSGLVVDWASESDVALEDLVIINEAFGCFAG